MFDTLDRDDAHRIVRALQQELVKFTPTNEMALFCAISLLASTVRDTVSDDDKETCTALALDATSRVVSTVRRSFDKDFVLHKPKKDN